MSLYDEVVKRRKENENNPNYPSVFWIDYGKKIRVTIGGNTEDLSVEEVKKNYKDNEDVMLELYYLLESFYERSDSYVIGENGQRSMQSYSALLQGNTGVQSVLTSIDEFTSIVGGSEEAYALFNSLYGTLIKDIIYDEKYASEQKRQDSIKGLTAFEIRQQDIERTKQDKRGVCTTFSMRISDELTRLGIPNKLLISIGDIIHWTVMYKIGDEYFVEDITQDLIYSEMLGIKPTPMSMRIPIDDFLIEHPQTSIVEDISDNGKMMEELSVTPLTLDLLKKRQDSRKHK